MNSYQHSKRGLKMRQNFSLLMLFSAACHPVYAAEDMALNADLAWLEAEKIEVVSKKKENRNTAAGIVSVVTHEEIERYGGNSLFDVLNRVTSIYGASSYSWLHGIASVRGDLFTHVNSHTLILINGRPFRDSVYGGLNETVLRSFPIHQIEQIEVIRGPGSVLYGTNAYSGVINIVTKKQEDNKLTLRGRYGSYTTGQVESEFAWKNQQASVGGAVRYHNSNGWLFNAQDELNKPSSFHRDEDEASVSLYGKWQDFTFNTFFAHTYENHWGPAATIGNNYPGENNRLFADLGHEKELNPHWKVKSNITYNRSNNSIYVRFAGQDLLSPINSSDLLLEQTHFFNFFDNSLNLSIGGTVEWQKGYESLVNGPTTIYNVLPYRYFRSSLYGEINYNIFDNLKLNIGGQWLRFEQSGVAADDGKVARLGLVYELTPEIGFKSLYSQAFRMPAALELASNNPGILVGNSKLKPEHVETIDLQVFYHSKNYEASLTAFRSRQSGLIDRISVPAPVVRTFANTSSVIFKGLELENKAKLFGKLNWTGSYTFQTNYTINGSNNATLVPNHMAKIGLSYDVTAALQISVFDTFFSKAKVFPTALQVNPPATSYHYLTVNSNYRLDDLIGSNFAKHVTFSFYLDNLLNEKIYYPEFNRRRVNTMPASPGRSLFGELSIEF